MPATSVDSVSSSYRIRKGTTAYPPQTNPFPTGYFISWCVMLTLIQMDCKPFLVLFLRGFIIREKNKKGFTKGN